MMAFYLILAIFLAVLDQLVKLAVRQQMGEGQVIDLIPNLINLTYQENRGISFSLFADLPESMRALFLTGVSALVVLGLLVYLKKHWPSYQRGERLGFALILGGALGNLIDRGWRGSVTDYMHFYYFDQSFFVNNLADDLISIGFVLVLIYSFKERVHEK